MDLRGRVVVDQSELLEHVELEATYPRRTDGCRDEENDDERNPNPFRENIDRTRAVEGSSVIK
ncbi:MAG: hypothetical protein ACOCY6_05470 [Halodesulfurarchaeum sp.]